MSKTLPSLMVSLWLGCSGHTVLAEQTKPVLDCDAPLSSAPQAIKRTLGPLYHGAPPAAELLAASADLQQLVSAATYCRIYVQSPSSGSDQTLAREWVSLHIWINRLADFVYLNAKGKDRVDWKLEYADFAELYEFET